MVRGVSVVVGRQFVPYVVHGAAKASYQMVSPIGAGVAGLCDVSNIFYSRLRILPYSVVTLLGLFSGLCQNNRFYWGFVRILFFQ